MNIDFISHLVLTLSFNGTQLTLTEVLHSKLRPSLHLTTINIELSRLVGDTNIQNAELGF